MTKTKSRAIPRGRRPLPDRTEWQTTTALHRLERRPDGRTLLLYVAPMPRGAWQLAALETPAVPGDAWQQGLFENHAHKLLAEAASLAEGLAAADAYAATWKASNAAAEPCGCGEIAIDDVLEAAERAADGAAARQPYAPPVLTPGGRLPRRGRLRPVDREE